MGQAKNQAGKLAVRYSYVYTADDTLVEGKVEAGKRYMESDFNKIIDDQAAKPTASKN